MSFESPQPRAELPLRELAPMETDPISGQEFDTRADDFLYYAEQLALETHGDLQRGSEEFLTVLHRYELEISQEFDSDNQ